MKKKFLSIAIILVMVLGVLFTLSTSSNADIASPSLYVNLGSSKTVGGKKIGYAIGNPKTGGAKSNYIWEINQYNSNNVSDKATNLRNLYCIKAEYGRTWSGTYETHSGNEAAIVEYNLKYDLQTQRAELLGKLVDADASTVIKNLLDPSKDAYYPLLWILDNAYIPGQTDKDNYLQKLGVTADPALMGDPITDEDILAIQKVAIWYFTNYVRHDDMTYNPADKYEIYNKISSDTNLWLNITEDDWTTIWTIGEGANENLRSQQTDMLYKNLIQKAKDGASEYAAGDKTINVDTSNLTEIAEKQYKTQMSIKNGSYVIGPIKITGRNNSTSEIQMSVKNSQGTEIAYEFSSADGTVVSKELKDFVGDTNGFYIKVPAKAANAVNIEIKTKNTVTTKTLWLKGTETDTQITLDGEQPLVEITRKEEEETIKITAESFDLALRKYIIKIERNGSNVTIDSRKPNIIVAPLDNGTDTTATYNHRKDPITIKTNDIVTYSVTVYNEGAIDGYASKIIDQLPDGLQFIQENSGVYQSTRKDGKSNTYKSAYNPNSSGSLKIGEDTLSPKSILFTIDTTTETHDLKAHTTPGAELDWETITFKCKVVQEPNIISASADSATVNKNKVTLTNVAWIAEDSNAEDIDDRDSQPATHPNENNSSLNTKGEDVGYTGKDDYTRDQLDNSNKYYKGEQDDDDFEKLELLPEKKIFDLGLKKFIAAISHNGPTIEDDEYLKEDDGTYTRAPIVTGIYTREQVGTTISGQKITDTVMYKDNDKDPLLVRNGDYVLYIIRVYNHGEVNGYASLIKDSIPDGLEYVIDSDINADYFWNIEDYHDEHGKTVVTTDYFKKNGKAEEKGEKALLKALNQEAAISEQNPDYIDVPVLCKVVEPQDSNRILTNYAQISEETDEDGNKIDEKPDSPTDIDSTPDEWKGEDDEDIEKVKLQYLDLALRKYITAINGVEQKDNNGKYLREPVVDLTPLINGTDTTAIYNHPKTPLGVNIGDKVVYTLRIYNEGDIAGYANEVKDYLPPYLTFVKDSDINKEYGWEISTDGRIATTKYLSDKEIDEFDGKKLDYEDIKIECEISDAAKANEKITNIAEISEYKYEDTIIPKDIDSESDNIDEDLPEDKDLPTYKDDEIEKPYVPGNEDDDDFEKVYVKVFDLSLRKFITKVNDEKVEPSREPVVDVTPLVNKTDTTAIYNHPKTPVSLKVGDKIIYTIRVYNEGEIDGFANEVKDYLPLNLTYLKDSEINKKYGWEISEDGRIATTKYLSDKEISAFDGKKLDYEDIEIECEISNTAKAEEKLTNIAEISEYKYDETIVPKDIDSESDNIDEDLPEDKDLPTYKDDEIEKPYVPGNEDDDDFEKVVIKRFDLALRKFITQVADKEITNRVPQPKLENGKISYEHTKEPVVLHVGDVVIYTLRIYNEGEIDGYASEITDDIPEHLEYLPDNDTNKEYIWKMYDEDGNETTDVNKAVKIKTTYLSKENEKQDGDNLLKAFDGNNLSYRDIKVAFKVKDPNSNQIIITNKAQISDDRDKDNKPVDDDDSTPDEWNEGEDDQDEEHVKVEYFDLALLKYVTKVIVIEDGKEKISETGYNGLEDPEPIVKVELHRKKLNSVVVKFGYAIKITNEGDIAGYANEITDYIPEGLKFVAEDNPGWTDEGNNVISTRLLEGKLLQPGESATVEVILTWINGANNLAEKTNTAEISEDDNEFDVPDKDSTPDNKVPGEDDIDIAKVMLAISTGAAQTYFGLTLGLLTIVLVGVVLIKKFVL